MSTGVRLATRLDRWLGIALLLIVISLTFNHFLPQPFRSFLGWGDILALLLLGIIRLILWRMAPVPMAGPDHDEGAPGPSPLGTGD